MRELRNAIERAILLCDGGLITREHLPAAVGGADGAGSRCSGTATARSTRRRSLPAAWTSKPWSASFVEKALGQAKGNKSKAARLLGLTRAQLYSRLEKYGL